MCILRLGCSGVNYRCFVVLSLSCTAFSGRAHLIQSEQKQRAGTRNIYITQRALRVCGAGHVSIWLDVVWWAVLARTSLCIFINIIFPFNEMNVQTYEHTKQQQTQNAQTPKQMPLGYTRAGQTSSSSRQYSIRIVVSSSSSLSGIERPHVTHE